MCVPSALPPGCCFHWITILFSGKEHFNVQPPVSRSSAVPERLLLFSPLNVLMQYIKSALSCSIETINNIYLLQTYIRCLYLFALKSFVGNKLSLAENCETFIIDAEQSWWRIPYEASETEFPKRTYIQMLERSSSQVTFSVSFQSPHVGRWSGLEVLKYQECSDLKPHRGINSFFFQTDTLRAHDAQFKRHRDKQRNPRARC